MIILDTDVLSLVHRRESAEGLRVVARIAQLPRDEIVATTIITYHEQTRGWLAYIAQARTKEQQVKTYAQLQAHLGAYQRARVVPYDAAAADKAEQFRSIHRRMGISDLRIAAIAVSCDALLVTRNLKDFEHIEGLRVEDWTKP